ncbi:hypothetical protein HQ535_07180 [bacterium]|nr:hypothetical protein [bacterium]
MTDPGLTTVATFESRDEADITVALLGSQGISAMVVADDEGGLNPGFFTDYSVRVVVSTTLASAAGAVIDEAGPAPADA